MTRKAKQLKPRRARRAPAEVVDLAVPPPPDGAPDGAALDSEIALQRQVNQRLLGLWDSLDGARDETEQNLQVKVAAVLTNGTGRVARLLRDQRALNGQAADGLTAAIATALDELSSELGVAL